MSVDRGIRSQHWLADYLAKWWPLAEAVGSGRRGTDVLNTPGVAWENKACAEFKPTGFIRQATATAGKNLPVAVYWPTGCGQKSVEYTLAIVTYPQLKQLLDDAGYTPGGYFEAFDDKGADDFDPVTFHGAARLHLDRMTIYRPRGSHGDDSKALGILALHRFMAAIQAAGFTPPPRFLTTTPGTEWPPQ